MINTANAQGFDARRPSASLLLSREPTNGFTNIIDGIASHGLFAALSLVFIWFGAMKFTAYEAAAIEGLIANSPLIFFLLDIFGTQGISYLIGTVEIAIGALLALRLISPKLGAVGAAGAAITFLLTFTFFFSTPGVFEASVGGLGISVLPGQFLLKDIVLFTASVAALSSALKAIR